MAPQMQKKKTTQCQSPGASAPLGQGDRPWGRAPRRAAGEAPAGGLRMLVWG